MKKMKKIIDFTKGPVDKSDYDSSCLDDSRKVSEDQQVSSFSTDMQLVQEGLQSKLSSLNSSQAEYLNEGRHDKKGFRMFVDANSSIYNSINASGSEDKQGAGDSSQDEIA